jgi:hypothetical protein
MELESDGFVIVRWQQGIGKCGVFLLLGCSRDKWCFILFFIEYFICVYLLFNCC